MWSGLISAPTWVSGSIGLPTFSFAVLSVSRSRNASRLSGEQNPRCIRADLSLGIKVAEHRGRNGVFQMGIIKDDKRRLSSELHGKRFKRSGGTCHYLLPGLNRARERYFVNARMTYKGRTHADIAVHDIKDAVRQASLCEDSTQLNCGGWCQLRWLEDKAIARGERGGRLPSGDLNRVIPGPNAKTDAQGLASCVGEGAGT